MRCYLCKADISHIGDGTGYGVYLDRYCESCWVFKTQGAACQSAINADPISRPSHYVKGGMEARRVIRAWELTYHCGDAVAYILRAKFKGNYAEDLRKAIQHLEFELEEETKK